MKIWLSVKEKVIKIISAHRRNTTFGKLESASYYAVDKVTAQNATLQMLRRSRKMHFVYGHTKFNENGHEIGTVFYMPVRFTRRQYNWLAHFQRLEYSEGLNDYYIYAEHRGTWES